jgi:surface protein
MLGLGLGLSKSPGPLGDPAPFITEWRTDTDGETITIPIITNNTYTYTTSDGPSGTTNGGSTTITFPTAGTHEVFISGDIQQIQFNNTGDKGKIYDIKQWGTDTTYVNLELAFYGCSNLDVTASDTPNINGSRMAQMFRNCVNLEGTSAFNRWNTTGVVGAGGIFDGATLFNQDISNWDTSTFFGFSTTFKNTSFNQDIGNWNTSSITSTFASFQNTPFNQDIGNWDVSNVTNMVRMFQDNTVFDQDISGWDITSATNFANFLSGGTLSTSNYDALLIGWEATLQGTYPNGVGYGATININFGNSQYTAGGAAELARISLQDNYNWAITDGGIGAYTPDVFVTEWETTLSPQTITIPLTESSTYTITTSEGDSAINFTGTNPTVTFPTAGTHQVIINGDVKQIVFNDIGDKEKILDIKQWGTDTTWVTFGNSFRGCENLDVTASDTPKFRTTSPVVMSNVFKDCINLIGTPAFNNWDVSNASNLFAAFNGATYFNQNIGNWDVSNVNNMGSVFRNSSFNQDIGDWDVSNVGSFGQMLRNTPFNQDISGWDITSATNLNNFLFDVTLSTSNYDALLIGWEATLQGTYPNGANYGATISPNFGNSQYTAGGAAEAARDSLENTFGWAIADGGSV